MSRRWKLTYFDEPKNFGDVLTPLIFRRLGIKFDRVPIEFAEIISTGSISRLAPNGCHILGSGRIHDDEREAVNVNAVWRWVRGPLTQKNAIKKGSACPAIFGDPALLSPEVFGKPSRPTRRGTLIIPHYQHFKKIDREFRSRAEVMNVCADPMLILEKIAHADRVISSSLHGIIIAHAYGIPASMFTVPGNPLWGSGIKFRDYFESVGVTQRISTIEQPVFMEPGELDMSKPLEILKEYAN